MSSETEFQPWSANEYSNLALVQEVKKHPCLYNNTIPEYSQKDVTRAVWQEIADKFGCTVPTLRKKWKNIRTVYWRKKVLQLRGKRKKKHYLDNQLTFLLPFTHSRNLMKEFASFSSKGKTVVNFNSEQSTSDKVENNSTKLGRNSAGKIKRTRKKSVMPSTGRLRPIMPRPAIGTSVDSPGVASNPVEISGNVQNNVTATYFIAPTPISCDMQKDSACLSIDDSDDFRKQFMMSLLPEVEEMSEPKFRSFKRKILLLIDDIKAEE